DDEEDGRRRQLVKQGSGLELTRHHAPIQDLTPGCRIVPCRSSNTPAAPAATSSRRWCVEPTRPPAIVARAWSSRRSSRSSLRNRMAASPRRPRRVALAAIPAGPAPARLISAPARYDSGEEGASP